jgi:hypothetical protein
MAKVISFRAEYGTSVEVRGTWHKLYCAIEIQPDEGESVSDIKDKAWNTVFSEIESQIKEIR